MLFRSVKEGAKREVKVSDCVLGQKNVLKREKSNKRPYGTNDVITDGGRGVRGKSDDTKTSGARPLPDQQKSSASLPNVAFFGDSVLRGVNERRLGKSYGFFASSICYRGRDARY